MTLTSAEIELLHAAAGMDFLRQLSPSGDLIVFPLEVKRLIDYGLIESTGTLSCRITQKGIDELNHQIDLKF